MKLKICIYIVVTVLACAGSFLLGENRGMDQGQMVAEVTLKARMEQEMVEALAQMKEEVKKEVAAEIEEKAAEEKEDKPAEKVTDPFTAEEKSKIVLVNKSNKLPDDYTVSLKKLPDGTNYADMKAYDAMCSMLKDSRKEGIILEVCSSYRSVERQKELFEEDMRALVRKGYSYLDAYDEVARETMPPGYSEHSTGLAFDIVALDYQMLNEKQERTEENQWLQAHCAEYGFILRYPKDKEEITGISYESWHFRYVGVEMAKYIMEEGITLEEFLAE